jgi:hypothetical protein
MVESNGVEGPAVPARGVRSFDTNEEVQKNVEEFVQKVHALGAEHGLASVLIGVASMRKDDALPDGGAVLMQVVGLGYQPFHLDLATQLYKAFVAPVLKQAERAQAALRSTPEQEVAHPSASSKKTGG